MPNFLYDSRASEMGLDMDPALLTQHKFKQHGKKSIKKD